jgi:SHS2 domain-containing protein
MGCEEMRETASQDAGKPGWEHFPHAADVGVRGFGKTPAEAFEQAMMALTAVLTHAAVVPKFEVKVICEAPDLELLFVEWLNAVIYEMAVRNMLFSRSSVRIDGTASAGLRAEGRDLHRAAGCQRRSRHLVGGLRRGRVMEGSDGPRPLYPCR